MKEKTTITKEQIQAINNFGKVLKKWFQETVEKMNAISKQFSPLLGILSLIEIPALNLIEIPAPAEPDVLQDCIEKVYKHLRIQNCFLLFDNIVEWVFTRGYMTRLEAKKYVLELLIKEVIAYYNDGWLPDFNYDGDEKYTFYYNYNTLKVEAEFYSYSQRIAKRLYMKSQEVVKKVKKTLKTENNNYLLSYFECLRNL